MFAWGSRFGRVLSPVHCCHRGNNSAERVAVLLDAPAGPHPPPLAVSSDYLKADSIVWRTSKAVISKVCLGGRYQRISVRQDGRGGLGRWHAEFIGRE